MIVEKTPNGMLWIEKSVFAGICKNVWGFDSMEIKKDRFVKKKAKINKRIFKYLKYPKTRIFFISFIFEIKKNKFRNVKTKILRKYSNFWKTLFKKN